MSAPPAEVGYRNSVNVCWGLVTLCETQARARRHQPEHERRTVRATGSPIAARSL
jgi:hypothetical protein